MTASLTNVPLLERSSTTATLSPPLLSTKIRQCLFDTIGCSIIRSIELRLSFSHGRRRLMTYRTQDGDLSSNHRKKHHPTLSLGSSHLRFCHRHRTLLLHLAVDIGYAFAKLTACHIADPGGSSIPIHPPLPRLSRRQTMLTGHWGIVRRLEYLEAGTRALRYPGQNFGLDLGPVAF